ncbi:hypothetical protein [Mucilaginibacter sp. SP1R1]|uniref:hypothetical protein n=1 Tax=Mucilaginibacter sp. SP1R1 TaxID=2723091 RepID=UPI0016115DEA|nr:hypothetical protein [Mucilaginibacter sp. SP1R1]MBB6148481.1 hypothetical protein [Mucilaginibacter sp. SP1R1]
MKEKFYLKILEVLAQGGLYVFIDISEIMQEIPLYPGMARTAIFINEMAVAYLRSMNSNKHIEFTDSTSFGHNQKLRLVACITPEGLKFYQNQQIIASVLATNKASQKTFIVVLISSILTFFSSLV